MEKAGELGVEDPEQIEKIINKAVGGLDKVKLESEGESEGNSCFVKLTAYFYEGIFYSFI